MDFYASLTINRCHLERLCEIWASRSGENGFPFECAIVSPLFARNGILPRLHHHRKQCKVIFDSGGFFSQQGRVDWRSMSLRLRNLYLQNGWANRLVLPDAPITSFDSHSAVRRKLTWTRKQYEVFPLALPASLRTKLLPVIHGMTPGQVQRSAQAARLVGSKSLGFGSFQTSGPNAGVNSFTPRTLRLLVQFAQLCAKWRLGAHVFGIGGPAAIPVLHYAGAKSFDSAGWIRTAAYGNVQLPYLGAVNITGATASRRVVTRREFNRLRSTTGHICPFCVDEVLLKRSWRHRALHNYCTVKVLARSLKETSASEALARLRKFNPRFATYLEIVLQERARHDRNSASPESSADL